MEAKTRAIGPFRTDTNRNPTAFTTDIAAQAGLILGDDYAPGTPFPSPSTLVTAHLLHDPIATTIRVIDAVGFYTTLGLERWVYIAMPQFIWKGLSYDQMRDVIGFMYEREGGTAMRPLFPNYGKL